MSNHSETSVSDFLASWAKVLVAWFGALWGSFSVVGGLQVLSLALACTYTAQQIYLNWRDRMRKQP